MWYASPWGEWSAWPRRTLKARVPTSQKSLSPPLALVGAVLSQRRHSPRLVWRVTLPAFKGRRARNRDEPDV